MAEPIVGARKTNACALLNASDYETLVGAANEYLAAQGALMSLMNSLGGSIEKGFERLPDNFRANLTNAVREALEYAHDVALSGMDKGAGREASSTWYSTLAVASGGVGGFFGLPAILMELPVTTLIILRSIADVARSKGAALEDVGVRATCLEAFAYGGPLDNDDEADIAFLASRVGAPQLAEVIAKVAVRYTATVAPKIALQAVPITGAVLGAGLNWSYMKFYQAMASVLFTLRPIEMKYERDQVRSCFASVVQELKSDKEKIRRKASVNSV